MLAKFLNYYILRHGSPNKKVIMSKYKISSGEFIVYVESEGFHEAGSLGIILHRNSNHPSELGEFTLIEKVDDKDKMIEQVFILTEKL